MTCIVGIALPNGEVWIGGDSAGTSDSGIQVIRKDRKVFWLNCPEGTSPMLVGGTTSFRFLQLLHYALEIPSYDPCTNPEQYLVTAFIDAVRACLKARGYDKKDEGEEQGGEFLVGWQGKLYYILDDYQVCQPVIGYHAVGSGASIALGVLFATQKLSFSPEERIQMALQAAAYHCRGVRPPFIIEKMEWKIADSKHLPISVDTHFSALSGERGKGEEENG